MNSLEDSNSVGKFILQIRTKIILILSCAFYPRLNYFLFTLRKSALLQTKMGKLKISEVFFNADSGRYLECIARSSDGNRDDSCVTS